MLIIMHRIFLVPLIALLALISGCGNGEPSNKIFEDYFKQTVNNSWLFSNHFEIVELKRVNGWKDGENYVIEGNVKLKSKSNYLDILNEIFQKNQKDIKEDRSAAMQFELELAMNNMSPIPGEFLKFWEEELKQDRVPASLGKSVANNIEAANILITTDRLLISELGNVIGRDLKKGDELTRRYTMSFKKTERLDGL